MTFSLRNKLLICWNLQGYKCFLLSGRRLGNSALAFLGKPKGEAVIFDTGKGMKGLLGSLDMNVSGSQKACEPCALSLTMDLSNDTSLQEFAVTGDRRKGI